MGVEAHHDLGCGKYSNLNSVTKYESLMQQPDAANFHSRFVIFQAAHAGADVIHEVACHRTCRICIAQQERFPHRGSERLQPTSLQDVSKSCTWDRLRTIRSSSGGASFSNSTSLSVRMHSHVTRKFVQILLMQQNCESHQ